MAVCWLCASLSALRGREKGQGSNNLASLRVAEFVHIMMRDDVTEFVHIMMRAEILHIMMPAFVSIGKHVFLLHSQLQRGTHLSTREPRGKAVASEVTA